MSKQIAIDWNRYMTGLAGKVNADFSNSDGNVNLVIEYKVNPDGSWYRRYQNGWLEQGGFFDGGGGGWQNVKVSFVKPFKDTSYQLYCLGNWSGPECSSCRIIAKTTTTADVTCANNTANVQNNIWNANGMGA